MTTTPAPAPIPSVSREEVRLARLVGIAGEITANSRQLTSNFCVAWVESRGALCGKSRHTGLLCSRHHTTAQRKRAALQDRETRKEAALIARERAAAPRMRAELAEITEWLNAQAGALTPPLHDRAATGGNIHPQISRRLERSWQRGAQIAATMRRKQARAEHLRDRLAIAERETPPAAT